MTTRRRKPKPLPEFLTGHYPAKRPKRTAVRGTPAAAPAKSPQSLDFTYLHLTLTHKEHRVEHSINFTGTGRPSENLSVIEDVLEEMEHFIARLEALKPKEPVPPRWEGTMVGATCLEDMV